jgi:hypothetical protein
LKTREGCLDAAGATHRAKGDTTGRNKGLATVVSGDGSLGDINLGRDGTALVDIRLRGFLPPA